MNRLIFFLLFFILSSCSGYEPIFSDKKNNFGFERIDLEGDNQIGENIKKRLLLKSSGEKKYSIFIKSKKNKETISSNSKGDPSVFRLKIKSEYLLSKEQKVILKNTIFKEVTYNNINDKFELLKYEENITDIISENIADEILISVTSSE